MVSTRTQYENMSKEELIQELTVINSSFVNNINAKLIVLSKDLTSLHRNMTKSILNCSNVNASTLIYLPKSFNWSVMLLLILNIIEERQLN